MKNQAYYDFFHQSPQAFSCHRVIINEHGLPCDYDFTDINDAFAQLTGLQKADVLHHRYTELFTESEIDVLGWFDVYRAAAIYRKTIVTNRYNNILKKWLTITVFGIDDNHFACCYAPALETDMPLVKANFFETLDHLQGIVPKSTFDQRVEAEINRSDRFGEPVSLLLLEIELNMDIQNQNSTLTMDRLKQTVSIFLSLIRKYDVLTREIGLRFMLLMPKTDEEGAAIVVNRIRTSLKSSITDALTVKMLSSTRRPAEPITDWYRRTELGE